MSQKSNNFKFNFSDQKRAVRKTKRHYTAQAAEPPCSLKSGQCKKQKSNSTISKWSIFRLGHGFAFMTKLTICRKSSETSPSRVRSDQSPQSSVLSCSGIIDSLTLCCRTTRHPHTKYLIIISKRRKSFKRGLLK